MYCHRAVQDGRGCDADRVGIGHTRRRHRRCDHGGYNAGIDHVVNVTNHKGGTLTYGWSGAPDSTDPGNTYSASMWNFNRLYAMPLMTFKSCPGVCGLQLVPDLATAPGVVSANGLTWTYHLKPDVKFEDGTVVTSSDVKYAIERTFATSVFSTAQLLFGVAGAPDTGLRRPLQGHDPRAHGPPISHDPQRHHHRVPPGQTVR